jgi:amino acid transporter
MPEQNHPNRFVKTLLIFVRGLLLLTIVALIFSCLLMLVFGFNSGIVYGIIWFCGMGSFMIYYFSILVFISVAIYCKVKKEKVWQTLKREVKLFGISILCVLILAFINNCVAPHY